MNPTNRTWRCHQSFLFLLVEDLVFSVEFKEPRSHPKGCFPSWEGDLQLGFPWQLPPYPIQPFPMGDFNWELFPFLSASDELKMTKHCGFLGQHLQDIFGLYICYFMSGSDFFPLQLMEIVIPTCRVPSWTARIGIWTHLLLFVFCFILGRAGYEEGQEGSLNCIKSWISPMERGAESIK